MEWKYPVPPPPKRALMSKSEVKTMLICFFDCKGAVLREFFPHHHIVNQKFCLQVLERLRRLIRCVRPELFPDKWILRHDNAPPCTALSVKKIFGERCNHDPRTPHLLTRSRSMWLLTLAYQDGPSQGITFWKYGRDSEGYDCRSYNLQKNDFRICFDKWKQRWNHV
jgi:hypothetical protein